MTLDELTQALDAAETGTPEQAVTSAIAVYLAASGMVDAYAAVKDSAKRLIGDVMTETGQTTYTTPAGKVAMTSPSTSVNYDSKALDALCASSAELAHMLQPHRKVSEKAGTMRITSAK